MDVMISRDRFWPSAIYRISGRNSAVARRMTRHGSSPDQLSPHPPPWHLEMTAKLRAHHEVCHSSYFNAGEMTTIGYFL